MTKIAGSGDISGRPRRLSDRRLKMAKGIRDKVAILGMGCAKFGERWDKDEDQLMLEAYEEAMADAGIEASQIDAAWLGAAFDAQNIGPSGIPPAVALRSEGRRVVEGWGRTVRL